MPFAWCSKEILKQPLPQPVEEAKPAMETNAIPPPPPEEEEDDGVGEPDEPVPQPKEPE